jgi:integrase/recombinase XerD
LERRRDQVDCTRALTRGQLDRLFARRDLPLRERTLWRLLYETAARANELLALDVEDLDLANRRARVRSKGGAVEWVFWQTGSAQLLPRLLAGRTRGPVFLATRRPARAVASLDVDPTSRVLCT